MADVPSAKEQVLQGPVGEDILPLILQHLGRIPVVNKGNGDLRNAALVCKAFSKPALDLLWQTLTSLDPLLPFVMPPSESAFPNNGYTGQPSCPRFDSYRKRVHGIAVTGIPRNSSMADWSAGCKAVLRMCHILQEDLELKLFPNLKTIFLTPNEDMGALVELMPFLLTPSIRGITLDHFTLPLAQLFPLVAVSCPSTQFLGVRLQPPFSPEATTEIIPLEHLSPLKHLKSLTVSADWNSQRIVKISSIHHLLLQLPLYDSLVAPLETFVLHYRPTTPARLQPLHSLPAITSLTLVLDANLFTYQEVASFVLTVALLPRLSSYAMYGADRPNANLLTINVGDILPLLSSKTLKTIILRNLNLTHRAAHEAASSPMSITLPPSNAIVESIVGALNRHSSSPVVELYLPEIISPLPTFDSLMRFADNAPGLTKLEISISSSVPSGLDTQLEGSNHVRLIENSLKHLIVNINSDRRFSPDDYPLLAKCLDSWFPRLEKFTCYHNYSSFPGIDELRSEFQRARLSA
ncbi:hypothetical protein BKA70DRAFT_1307747 [Coprinopsis sp. MPI-PUGE-AT-0042]|nr:hypothetical protein BKA70DRAFT_1307747 [Coprinopsis sp. MPI-PUGE-AT-0042]